MELSKTLLSQNPDGFIVLQTTNYFDHSIGCNIELQKDEVLFKIEDDPYNYSNGISLLDIRHLIARPELFSPCSIEKVKPRLNTKSMSTTEKVKEFHELFEHSINTIDGEEPLKNRQLRIKLLFEELEELATASDCKKTFIDLCSEAFAFEGSESIKDGNNPNKLEELDALCDLQYVLDGKKCTSGLHEVFNEAFTLVHENNMNKAHSSEEHIKQTIEKKSLENATFKEKDGQFLLYDKNGKLTKPWNHKPVELGYLFE